ncbi:MAG: branched-chain amino acid aminotransferase [Rhodospirillales bacterium]|jgi:branched-chain amino acid aminotransferase|nr:branched-chain amino acid aminotransferase [Rhodospirillales bacterium]
MGKTGEPGYTISYIDGEWKKGNAPALGPMDDGVWLGASVFDGARFFDGVAPDLDRHCARSLRSAGILGMEPNITAEKVEAIAREGIAKFDPSMALYICPLFYMREHFFGETNDVTRFIMSISIAPMPEPKGFSACLTRYRRPSRDTAPTDAKTAALYPNVSRSVRAAGKRGFDSAVMLDPNGNVAEFSFTNLFMAKDGVVHTPAVNGTFLNGITRQRVSKLLRDDGMEVQERAIDFDELLEADEVFSTANYSKVLPCIKIEDREFDEGPIYTKARKLYFNWAKTTS